MHLKVIHVTMIDYSKIGGIQSFVHTLHDRLIQTKIQSRIISLGFQSKQKNKVSKGFRIPILGIYPYLLISSFFTAFSLCAKERDKACLIHAHDMLFGGLTGVFIKLMSKSPLIITDHGSQSVVEGYVYTQKYGNTFLSRLNRGFLLSVEKFVAVHADKIMCVSESSYNYFLKRGVDPEKMEIVWNGIDIERFKPKRSAFSNSSITILYAGRISAEKGVSALIKVFCLLEREYPNLKLLIVGEGHDKENVEKMFKKLKIDDKVLSLPSVNRDVIVDLYNNADIVAIPSVIETGAPLALLEAMACGRVVIANSSGSLPSMVNDAGLIVPFNNPPRAAELIKRILNDKKEALRLASLARERAVKNFNWQNCFKEILNVYISACYPCRCQNNSVVNKTVRPKTRVQELCF